MKSLIIIKTPVLNLSFGGAGGRCDPHRYDVQGSDTTMMTRAASLPGQKKPAIFYLPHESSATDGY